MEAARAIGAEVVVRAAGVVAMSDDGKRTIAIERGAVRLAGGRALMQSTGVVAAAALDGAAWIVTEIGGEHALHRFDAHGVPVGPATALGRLGAELQCSVTRIGVRTALLEGERAVFVREVGGEAVVESLGERGANRRVLLGGRGVVERRGNALAFLRASALAPLALPAELAAGVVVGGAMVLDGTAALVELELHQRRTAIVYDLRRGAIKARVRLGEAGILAVAERKGLVVLGRGAHIALLDLRAACCVGERILPGARACAIDADGKRILVVTEEGKLVELGASMSDWPAEAPAAEEDPAALARDAGDTSESLAAPAACTSDAAEPEEPANCAVDANRAAGSPAAGSSAAGSSAAGSSAERATVESVSSGADEVPAARAPDALDEAAGLALVALGATDARALSAEALEEYLADTRAWIGALCRTALASAADTGRIARQEPGAPLYAAELEAVVAERGGRALEQLADARAQEREASEQFGRWNRRGAPHVEIARELGLSPMATTVMLIIAAPQIWGELARAYGLCVADNARPLVDELLLAHLLEADTATRSAIGRELDDDAPLVALGIVEVARGLRPYAGLAVHPAIARRLAGAAPAADLELLDRGARGAALAELIGPRAELAEIARALAAPATEPVRVVLRGRPGVGRRTTAAALAANAARRIGLVAIEGAAADLEARLRQRLRDVALRGDVPCVTVDGLAEDPALRARIRGVLDAHVGPLFVRAPRTGELPIAPGHLAVDFVPLTETERRAAWSETLAARELPTACAEALARRFSVGPGAMSRAVAAVARTRATDLEGALAAAIRQHRSARIEAIATRVEKLAGWDELIVPEDIGDSLRELVARVHHRRTVLEDWGLERVAATAQAVTALFQGGPGTGKTMAAEVIARALGYELWRVDLSKVVSKWIGETEKNLAAVFDAAEDGEIVLLFDEADSLFGKRTEVKSSHDRNANLETNYLLQRLDAFTGIAILTTNFGTSIDPAFRRRLSVQAQFPFPDEIDRERMWRKFLPARLPVAGDLDLAELARKYELTGGYIRNAVLRAAYLAASKGAPLCGADLERAVRAEYLARGKVSATGALN